MFVTRDTPLFVAHTKFLAFFVVFDLIYTQIFAILAKYRKHAGVAELADASGLGPGTERCESSSLSVRTTFVKNSSPFCFFVTTVPV